jgi:hypothetical protein
MIKINEYMIEGQDFENLQSELGEFYKLPIPFASPFDLEDKRNGIAIETPRCDVSYGDMLVNITQHHNLPTLVKVILKNVSDYLGDDDIQILNCWATDLKKGSVALWHHHMPALVSGVYYHEFTEPESRIELMIDGVPTPFESKVGKMICWPSDTLHMIPLKTTDTKRRSISFNIIRKII